MTDTQHRADLDVLSRDAPASSGWAPATQREGRSRRWVVWARLSWWLELATVASVYLVYEVTRAVAAPRSGPARIHGLDILATERWAHLDPERTLNRFLAHRDVLSDFAGYYYSTLHWVVTPLVLIYLWRRRPAAYPRLRSALVISTLASLAVFVAWPVSPPRFATKGFVDTLVHSHILGMSNPHGVSGFINEYAAMPSLHVGWALWCAIAIVVTSGSRWRHLAWLYPALTTLVVMGTANHYLFDVFGGAAMILAALAFTGLPHRIRRDGSGPTAAASVCFDATHPRDR